MELREWLERNRISFIRIDDEVMEIQGFGRVFVESLREAKSIFRTVEGRIEFNLMEDAGVLMEEGIFYVVFPFGNNWYWTDLRCDFCLNVLKYTGERVAPLHGNRWVNLGIHTPSDLLNGAFAMEEWIRKAKHLGHGAIGICDRNTMASTLLLQKACDGAGMGFVMGYSLDCQCGDVCFEVKVYCRNQLGLRNLLRVQRSVMVDSEVQRIEWDDLLSLGGGNVLVFGVLSAGWLADHQREVVNARRAFDGVFYQFDVSEYKADRFDREVLEAVRCYMTRIYGHSEFGLPPVLICDCYYLDREDAGCKMVLNKIANGAAHRQSDDQFFKDTDEHFERVSALFGEGWDVESLFAELCGNTLRIATGACARFETGRMFMPKYEMRPEEVKGYGDRHRLFLALIEEGLHRLLPVADEGVYRERLREEVYIVESTNNIDYFLVQWDMVSEARRRGIAVGIGRGSAGGCLISFLLGLTSIDPLRYGLLFSRFLVPERCGLEWSERTVIGQDMGIEPGERFVLVCLDGREYRFAADAEFLVLRDGTELKVAAEDLLPDDDILLDRRDELWTMNELGV